MITGPTVAPIGDLSNSAGPTAGTISVELEEMPAIADGLDTVSRTCADRTMPILGIVTETRFFLGINGRAQQAAALCTGLAADLGMSAAKFGVTAAAVRAAVPLSATPCAGLRSRYSSPSPVYATIIHAICALVKPFLLFLYCFLAVLPIDFRHIVEETCAERENVL